MSDKIKNRKFEKTAQPEGGLFGGGDLFGGGEEPPADEGAPAEEGAAEEAAAEAAPGGNVFSDAAKEITETVLDLVKRQIETEAAKAFAEGKDPLSFAPQIDYNDTVVSSSNKQSYIKDIVEGLRIAAKLAAEKEEEKKPEKLLEEFDIKREGLEEEDRKTLDRIAKFIRTRFSGQGNDFALLLGKKWAKRPADQTWIEALDLFGTLEAPKGDVGAYKGRALPGPKAQKASIEAIFGKRKYDELKGHIAEIQDQRLDPNHRLSQIYAFNRIMGDVIKNFIDIPAIVDEWDELRETYMLLKKDRDVKGKGLPRFSEAPSPKRGKGKQEKETAAIDKLRELLLKLYAKQTTDPVLKELYHKYRLVLKNPEYIKKARLKENEKQTEEESGDLALRKEGLLPMVEGLQHAWLEWFSNLKRGELYDLYMVGETYPLRAQFRDLERLKRLLEDKLRGFVPDRKMWEEKHAEYLNVCAELQPELAKMHEIKRRFDTTISRIETAKAELKVAKTDEEVEEAQTALEEAEDELEDVRGDLEKQNIIIEPLQAKKTLCFEAEKKYSAPAFKQSPLELKKQGIPPELYPLWKDVKERLIEIYDALYDAIADTEENVKNLIGVDLNYTNVLNSLYGVGKEGFANKLKTELPSEKKELPANVAFGKDFVVFQNLIQEMFNLFDLFIVKPEEKTANLPAWSVKREPVKADTIRSTAFKEAIEIPRAGESSISLDLEDLREPVGGEETDEDWGIDFGDVFNE